ncbi:hypothetical protein MB46_12130 [Arthrobacter alpinus]|uniref:KAP family P-loop NTPase fold protein n=1 Tax=Arthrobacter alpinus TaxID=656366 RepID=UPI000678839E|nr:P-loop NTPase fold protein [Arthrobacter alpinus]ALV46119.1 hypothetical protein MB46_12130 [Arthrobacter alpinus]
MSNGDQPLIDNPINSSEQDVLGRSDVARDFAKSIRALDASQGLVVGVLGAWGHGKSSFINLMKEEFSSGTELTTIDFNPWLFSGSQQLTDVFFREIAAELRINSDTKLDAIADGIEKYGDVLSPIAIIPGVGAWWDRASTATKAAAAWWKNRRTGSRPLRDKISESLLKLEQPLLIVIDDIDRLTTPEIRDIFKLVRLTASFPNIIYLLAFDRRRVEQALSEDGVPGRDYLEKIVQLSFDLPSIPRELLRTQVFERLSPLLDGVEDLRFNQDDWSDIYFEIVEPLVASLRDVTRLALSARTTINALGSQIETVDLVALESVRIFRPEIFEELQKIRATLTGVSNSYGGGDNTRQQQEVDNLLLLAGKDIELIKKLILRIFPAARQYTENTNFGYDSVAAWKREHRVAYLGYLDLYFGRTAPRELIAFNHAERAYALFSDSYQLGAYLDEMKPEELEDIIASLETYEGQFQPWMIVPASVALLNRIYKIPDRPSRGMFDIMRPALVVGRVFLRLLRSEEEETERERIVREILPQLISYSTERDFLLSVGYEDGAGHKLVSAELAARLEESLIERVVSSHSTVPNEEWDLARVYLFVSEHQGEDYVPPTFTDPDQIRALITSARSVARSQTLDSRNVRKEERLAWDGIVRIFGDENQFSDALEILRTVDGDSFLVQLSDKYRSGWRPEREF